MSGPEDLQVILTYKQLDELLKAVEEIPKMRKEMKRYYDQVVALKGLYGQLLERVSEIMKLL